MTRRSTLGRTTGAAALVGAALAAVAGPALAATPRPRSAPVVLTCAYGAGALSCASDARTATAARFVWHSLTLRPPAQPRALGALARSLAASFGGRAGDARALATTHGRALGALGIRYARSGRSHGSVLVLPKGGLAASRPVQLIVLRGRFTSPTRLPARARRGSVLSVVVDRGSHAIIAVRLSSRAPQLAGLPPLRRL
jgi:hypothetical protein